MGMTCGPLCVALKNFSCLNDCGHACDAYADCQVSRIENHLGDKSLWVILMISLRWEDPSWIWMAPFLWLGSWADQERGSKPSVGIHLSFLLDSGCHVMRCLQLLLPSLQGDRLYLQIGSSKKPFLTLVAFVSYFVTIGGVTNTMQWFFFFWTLNLFYRNGSVLLLCVRLHFLQNSVTGSCLKDHHIV